MNYDRLFKVRTTYQGEKIKEICFTDEPSSGSMHVYTASIRIGDPLKVDGVAEMKFINPEECRIME